MTADDAAVLAALSKAGDGGLVCHETAEKARREVADTYRTLLRLGKEGLVAKERRIDGADVPRLYYRCTDKGAQALVDAGRAA
jgi:DNA-binding PadR family transcriptional regulator